MQVISFVVRAHGDAAAIERTTASLRAQRSVAAHIDVVDAGSRKALAAALEAGAGGFAGVCDAGDVFFPDHAERLAEALERSEATVAYAQALLAFIEGSDRVLGYGTTGAEPFEHHRLMSLDRFVAGAARSLIRREALRETAWLGGVSRASDHHVWLQLAQRGSFARVEHITLVHPCRLEPRFTGATLDTRAAEILREIYALYPVAERPRVAAERARALRAVERGDAHGFPVPTWRFPA